MRANAKVASASAEITSAKPNAEITSARRNAEVASALSAPPGLNSFLMISTMSGTRSMREYSAGSAGEYDSGDAREYRDGSARE